MGIYSQLFLRCSSYDRWCGGQAWDITKGTPGFILRAVGTQGCKETRQAWPGSRLWSWTGLPRIFALVCLFLCFKVFIEKGEGKKIISKLEVLQLL